MGRINAVRIINLNYNNNSIKVNDEIMYLNGESTLISLHNGGGKSVLVQMMSAPFVHSKYRNAKDRPFDSYFTTGRPTFILLEWLLDGGNGKVMTGYMIRQNQENDDENTNSLDITSVIAEYDSPCIYDIQSLPVVEKTKKEKGIIYFDYPVSTILQMGEEYSFCLILETEEFDKIYYYARIMVVDGDFVAEQMKFAKEFSDKTYDSEAAKDLIGFIDDNARNLAEAGLACDGLLTASPDIIPYLGNYLNP